MAIRIGAQEDVGDDGRAQGTRLHCEETHLVVHGGIVLHVFALFYLVLGGLNSLQTSENCRTPSNLGTFIFGMMNP